VRWTAALAVVALLVGSACTGDDDDAAPTTSTGPTSSTTVIDRSGIALAGVPGQTTSTIVERGTARLTGSVQGPSGLVVGATVRIERLVAGREIRVDLVSGPDGRFVLADVPGGRYRVRAFLPPTLAQVEPEIRFLEDEAEHEFTLVMEQHGGLVVRADVAPEPPLLDRAVNLVATVSTRSVDADGVVRSTPVAGVSVELTGLGRWVLREDDESTTTSSPFDTTTFTTFREEPSPSARTDGSGRVRYELRCERAGSPNLALLVPVRSAPTTSSDPTASTFAPTVRYQTISLDLPACVDPATTTTASTETPSSPPTTSE